MISRAMHPFGTLLDKDTGHIHSDFGPFSDHNTSGVLHPTYGRNFVLYHASGETDDQIVIHMPKESVLFATGNIYPIRGTSNTDAVTWAVSLD